MHRSPAASVATRRGREAERGQVLIMTVGGILGLLAMLSLAVDLGFWRNQQRQEQSAADSAAMAGSIAAFYPTTAGTPAPVQVRNAALLAATKNGYTDDGGATTTVAVNQPPRSGTHTSDASAVEVIVTKTQPSFFSAILGFAHQSVSARAVAVHTLDVAPACLYQISQTMGISLNAGSVVATNCSVAANHSIDVKGCTTATGIVYYGATAPSICNGTVTQRNTPIADPCIRIAGCSPLYAMNFPVLPPNYATPASPNMIAPPNPGYLYVTGPIVTPTVFSPGVYYIYGGIAAQITGVGVTIVNVDGGMTINGNSSSPSITAPTTGPTAGVAYFQPTSNSSPITFDGASSTWGGLFYAPSAAITSHGKSDTFSELIIGGFVITGNKTLEIDPTTAPAGVAAAQGTTHASLAE